MVGGLDDYFNTTSDCWILDIDKRNWRKVCATYILMNTLFVNMKNKNKHFHFSVTYSICMYNATTYTPYNYIHVHVCTVQFYMYSCTLYIYVHNLYNFFIVNENFHDK